MSKSPRQIVTEMLTIVSPNGKPRMLLNTDSKYGAPLIHFFDEEGRDRFQIGITPEGNPTFAMLREDGNPGITMGLNEKDMSGINVSYAQGAPGLQIILPNSGNIQIKVYDQGTRQIWEMK